MVISNIFERIPSAFYDEPIAGEDCIKLLGRVGNARVYKYILKKYIQSQEYLSSYNVLVPEANGSGAFGEALSSPVLSVPDTGAVDTFISIGMFQTQGEAEACLQYIKTKFARAMLGVMKVTQHNPKATWRYVPLQDFTPAPDIDWSLPIPDIDAQLYRKYGLDEEEIAFIESHVKSME